MKHHIHVVITFFLEKVLETVQKCEQLISMVNPELVKTIIIYINYSTVIVVWHEVVSPFLP